MSMLEALDRVSTSYFRWRDLDMEDPSKWASIEDGTKLIALASFSWRGSNL